MYLPLAVLVTAAVAAGYVALSRLPGGSSPRILAVIVVILLVVLYGMETRSRNRVYASEQHLWADTVAKDPRNTRARVAHASALVQGGRLREAEAEFRQAVNLDENDSVAHTRLASVLAAQGKPEDAVPHLRKAVALNDADVDAHRMLGQILAMQRKDSEAIRHLERALQAQSDNPQLLVQVASVLTDSDDASIRNIDRAVTLAERAVELTSRREAMALDVLGLAYARQGRFVEAVSAAQDGLAIARAAGNTAAASSIESRLKAYQARLIKR